MLDMITNTHKVKFVNLDKMYHNGYIGNKDVTVYINLECLINSFARANVEEYLKSAHTSTLREMISSIINLAAHYKWYFTKKGHNTKVILFLQHPFGLSRIFNRHFKNNYKSKYEYRFNKNPEFRILSTLIDNTVPYLSSIIDYIEDVHLVCTDRIESSVIPLILMDKNSHNIIVTKDVYDYQYNRFGFDIIGPKSDETILIGREWNIIEITKKESREHLYSLSPEMIIFLISLSGSPTKSIDSIKGIGIKKACNLIHKAIDENIITMNTSSPVLLMNLIKEEYKDEVMNNYYASNISCQVELISESDIFHIKEQIKNRFDNESLKKLNEEVFTDYPLNLIELTHKPIIRNKVVF